MYSSDRITILSIPICTQIMKILFLFPIQSVTNKAFPPISPQKTNNKENKSPPNQSLIPPFIAVEITA